MPENTVYVGRPSKWGNPFEEKEFDIVSPALRFACEVAPLYPDGFLENLRGKNLACWCKLSDECHADILLELANK
jgi:hypothetical protein